LANEETEKKKRILMEPFHLKLEHIGNSLGVRFPKAPFNVIPQLLRRREPCILTCSIIEENGQVKLILELAKENRGVN
jgi:hypothetical protein